MACVLHAGVRVVDHLTGQPHRIAAPDLRQHLQRPHADRPASRCAGPVPPPASPSAASGSAPRWPVAASPPSSWPAAGCNRSAPRSSGSRWRWAARATSSATNPTTMPRAVPPLRSRFIASVSSCGDSLYRPAIPGPAGPYDICAVAVRQVTERRKGVQRSTFKVQCQRHSHRPPQLLPQHGLGCRLSIRFANDVVSHRRGGLCGPAGGFAPPRSCPRPPPQSVLRRRSRLRASPLSMCAFSLRIAAVPCRPIPHFPSHSPGPGQARFHIHVNGNSHDAPAAPAAAVAVALPSNSAIRISPCPP